MDILTLKRYFIEQPTISKNAHKGEALASRSFIEFYINDQPLSSLLDKYYASNHFNTLKNNIGVFGSFSNTPLEIVKVKQLTGRKFDAVDFEELKKGLACKFNEEITLDLIDRVKDELSEPDILIYCCAQCGDYLCGGVWVKIQFDEHNVKWTFGGEDNSHDFVFDKFMYLATLKSYLNKIKSSQLH